MKFQPGMGRPPGSGRIKGKPNSTTVKMREAIIEAFDRAGGADYLLQVAHSDPKTFLQFARSIIPAEIHAEVKSAVDHVISVKTYYEGEPDVPLTSIVVNPVPALPVIDAELIQDGDGAFSLPVEPGEPDEP